MRTSTGAGGLCCVHQDPRCEDQGRQRVQAQHCRDREVLQLDGHRIQAFPGTQPSQRRFGVRLARRRHVSGHLPRMHTRGRGTGFTLELVGNLRCPMRRPLRSWSAAIGPAPSPASAQLRGGRALGTRHRASVVARGGAADTSPACRRPRPCIVAVGSCRSAADMLESWAGGEAVHTKIHTVWRRLLGVFGAFVPCRGAAIGDPQPAITPGSSPLGIARLERNMVYSWVGKCGGGGSAPEIAAAGRSADFVPHCALGAPIHAEIGASR